MKPSRFRSPRSRARASSARSLGDLTYNLAKASAATLFLTGVLSVVSTAAVSASVAPTPGPYSPLTPTRICDTRAGNPSDLSGTAAQCNGTDDAGSTLSAGSTLPIEVAGFFGVPADASAVVLNVTVVGPAAPGFLTVFPTGAARPTASNLNYTAGSSVPNLVEVGTGTGGEVSIYSLAQANVVVDLEGYVAPTAAGGGRGRALRPAARSRPDL
jgi:hypothetical protein